jgi:hypothetical protein
MRILLCLTLVIPGLGWVVQFPQLGSLAVVLTGPVWFRLLTKAPSVPRYEPYSFLRNLSEYKVYFVAPLAWT